MQPIVGNPNPSPQSSTHLNDFERIRNRELKQVEIQLWQELQQEELHRVILDRALKEAEQAEGRRKACWPAFHASLEHILSVSDPMGCPPPPNEAQVRLLGRLLKAQGGGLWLARRRAKTSTPPIYYPGNFTSLPFGPLLAPHPCS